MFRTLIVQQGEYLSVSNNWLVVSSSEDATRIPIEDIYCLIVDNLQTNITPSVLNRITSEGGHILFCNEKHLPVAAVYPHNTHYKPYGVLKRQLLMENKFKDILWQKIISAKLKAQAEVVRLCSRDFATRNHLERLSREVSLGDKENREGLGAKIYFKSLYGAEFIRFYDDGINAALNYGYTILRSATIKTLCAYGYQTVLGIHHISESNPFNLADDMMEPLRPLIDLWVYKNRENLVEEYLYREQRRSLVNIVNEEVEFEGKQMKMRNALDRYIGSLTSVLEKQNLDLLKIPSIIDLKVR